MKTTIRYSNLHDGGRIDDRTLTFIPIQPPDSQTLRTITWIMNLTPEKLIEQAAFKPASRKPA